jgi:hypothetical protein
LAPAYDKRASEVLPHLDFNAANYAWPLDAVSVALHRQDSSGKGMKRVLPTVLVLQLFLCEAELRGLGLAPGTPPSYSWGQPQTP